MGKCMSKCYCQTVPWCLTWQARLASALPEDWVFEGIHLRAGGHFLLQSSSDVQLLWYQAPVPTLLIWGILGLALNLGTEPRQGSMYQVLYSRKL